MKTSVKQVMVLLVLAAIAVWVTPAHADLKQIKVYKEAYPDAKPKCINCHVDEKPKKDDGMHEANAYGKAVMEQAGEEAVPTAETYQKVGSIEDFEQNADKK